MLQQPRVMLIAGVLFFCIGVPKGMFDSELAWGWRIFQVVMFGVSITAIDLWLHHVYVSQLRGVTSNALPKQFFRKYLQVVWRTLVIVLGVPLLFAVFMLSASILIGGWDPTPEQVAKVASTYNVLGGLFALTIFPLVGRLQMAFPAIAMGEPSTFRRSWRLTRGHTIRLFMAILPLLAWGQIAKLVRMIPGVGESSELLPMQLIWPLFCVHLEAMLAVWYERLRSHEEAAEDAFSFDVEAANYGQCQD